MKKHLFSSSDPIYEREVRELDEACNSLGEAMDKMNHIQYGIKEGKKTCQMVEDDYTIDNGPKALGLSHAALYAHSWKPIGPNWVWISKASAVQGIGYPASRNDVHRFGHTARRVRKKGPPPPLSKSFAVAVKEEGMARREPEQRSWKRRQDDWMEEVSRLVFQRKTRLVICVLKKSTHTTTE
jgi:hypothetical protein